MINDAAPEGATPLDPDEREGLKPKHITTRGELDELEQANIQTGLQWVSRSRQKDILTDDFLRTLHKRLFGEIWNWAGTYRQTEKNIGIDPLHIGVELRTLVDDARYWTENDTYPPLEAAARFHHRMVQIHPFPNGNGRHARIAADLYLERHFGHTPIEWTHGFDLQTDNERRNAYIAALRAADGGKFDPILELVGANQL
ncbi:mobile mystery protein B [Pelagibius sp. Alg239-R121]|uniref:mobile mystery protein B n=1 Tax=Pelagibius sp. Alg239-R121 TaxID=2993448 RepID=UPI0024A76EB9|nr:mobile mystery protein B [Pelagibius sp. Alg239-R121]